MNSALALPRRWPVGGGLLALACVARFVIVIVRGWRPIRADAAAYDQIAQALIHGYGFAITPGHPTANYPPLYPAWVALWYAMVGHRPVVVYVAQLALGCVTPVLMYLLARRWMSERAARVAGVVGALYVGFIGAESLLLAESLAVMLWLLTHLWLSGSMATGRWRLAIVAGIAMGGAILAKPLLLLYPFLLGGWLCTFGTRRRAIVLGWLLGVCISLAPWTLRNYRVFGAWVPVGSYSGMVLYASYFPTSFRTYGSNPTADQDPVVRAAQQQPSEVAEDRWLRESTWHRMRVEWPHVLKMLAVKAVWFWSPFDWEIISWDGHVAYNWGYTFLLPFALGGWWWARRQKLEVGWLLAPFLYLMGICLVFLALPRYRLLAEPYLYIFSAMGLAAWLTKRRPALRWLAAAGWLTVQLVVAARLPALLTWLHSLRGG